MSMLDLFRRHKPSPSPVLTRPASCVAMPTETDDELWLENKQELKRCATGATKSGWGIVPVLNELERRSSTNSLLRRRSLSAKQLLCLNCRRLFFPGASRCTPQSTTTGQNTSVPLNEQFCSLDCKSSYDCSTALQDLVDRQLHDSSLTSSDEDAVVTVNDDTDFSF